MTRLTPLQIRLTVTEEHTDVTRPRIRAQALAGRLLRAAARAMQSGDAHMSLALDIPGDAQQAAVTGASLLRLAQTIDPLSRRRTQESK